MNHLMNHRLKQKQQLKPIQLILHRINPTSVVSLKRWKLMSFNLSDNSKITSITTQMEEINVTANNNYQEIQKKFDGYTEDIFLSRKE